MPSPIDPRGSEVAGAIERLNSDPNLSAERTVRTLQWVKSHHEAASSGGTPWLTDLFSWLAQSARLIVWIAALVLAALLAIYIYRLVRGIQRAERAATTTPPSHVRGVDIRPESLPDDIGPAALELWERNEHRSALALLYRGLLSRLVHVHGLPIRESSTEGDCLALLDTARVANRDRYAVRLVRVWQCTVYGAQDPERALVLELCAGFAAALDSPPELDQVLRTA